MIRIAVVIGLTALFFSEPASADPIVVRSGDHDGFTRLVLRLPDDASWQISEEPGLKTIWVAGHDAGFDTSRVFDVIPRDLLLDVRPYPARLELLVSCACELNTFVEQRQFLVVDIVDGPPLPPSTETASARFISARPASGFNFGDLLWSEFSTDAVETVARAQEELESEITTTAAPTEKGAESSLIEQTRQQLLTEFSSAASRGVLRPATPNLDQSISELETPAAQEIYDSSEVLVSLPAPETGNMRITSSRDTPNLSQNVDLMTSGAVCASPDRVMVHSWGDDDPLYTQIADVRRTLFSEVDQLNEKAALKLARLYIYFGLGAEAKQVLKLSNDLIPKHPELIDLADIMEHGFARNPRFVHKFADCDSEFAFWAAMAAKQLPSDQLLNETAALRALAALPDHLRRHLAPILSKRLADHGSLESASIALRNVEWTELDQASSTDLAQATIEKQSGNSEGAEELLSTVILDNATETPEAMIAFVDSRLSEGNLIPADVALLIETYAFEWRDSPIARDIQRAHVIASAYSGQFAKAFEAMQSEIVAGDATLLAELTSHTFSALSSNADDVTFIDAFFSEFPSTSSEMSSKSVGDTASRLLELGFAYEAEMLLSESHADRKGEYLTLLHAEAFLALGQPEAALTVLDLVQNEKSLELRARALAQLGNNKAAFDLFQSLDADEEAMRSAWLASEWAELITSDAPVFGGARTLSDETIPAIAPRDGMLETIDSAVEQSNSARETLRNLLEGVPVER
ncbi:hypothetical protein [Roseobacter sp. A03A-229]